MRILVPLDGSLRAESVLHPLAVLARRATVPPMITLLSVQSEPEPEQHTQHYLAAMQQNPDLAQLTVRTKTIMGMPADCICREATAESTDLIVMASHVTALDPLTGESVAETVARCSEIPTLIIRPEGVPFPDVPRYDPLVMALVFVQKPNDVTTLAPFTQVARDLDADLLLRAQPQEPVTAYADLTELAHQMEAREIAVSRMVTATPLTERLEALLQTQHIACIAINLTTIATDQASSQLLRVLGDLNMPTLLFSTQ
jgi:nucleotide-binding universal stress UspA family protein